MSWRDGGGYLGPFYWRRAKFVFYLLPTVGCGIDQESGLPFFEVAFMNFAVGIGSSDT